MNVLCLRTTILAGFVIAAATLASPASAQPCDPDQVAKLLAGDGASGDQFGLSASVWSDVAVIGAHRDDGNGNGTDSGSAYVYRFDGTNWVQEAKLLADDGAADDQFGYSVSVFGDVALVGAFFDDDDGTNSGSAYIYRFDGTNWAQEAKLLASDGASGDEFGISVSVFGDVALVGARFDDDNGNGSGSAYVYRFDGTNWVQEAKLLASDGAANDRFGISVSVSSDVAVVGARYGNNNGTDSGSAYVYRFDGTDWTQEAKLLATDGATDDDFGLSVSVSSDVVVVGALFDDDNGTDSGSAYIYRFDGTNWVHEAKLLASDGAAGDWFGWRVSVSGETVVIAAAGHDDNGGQSGSAYIFRFNGAGWGQGVKLLASDGASGDHFGRSVAVFGDTAVIGAYRDADNGNQSGSAYIFDLSTLSTCLADVNGDYCLNPTDFTAWINAFNNNLPECDQNGDGSCTPTDFTAWIANFNAGC